MTETKSKKRIIFVDDEQKVIDGLKRMLFVMRDKWEMYFVTTGKRALEIMSAKDFDVIVSDMRMPEMDGAELLAQVKDLYPHTIRFILSGYSEEDMILKTVGHTHQFLTKPCNAEELKTVICAALDAQSAVGGKKELIAAVSKMNDLPSLPELYVKVRKLLESPSSSFQDISDVIAKDISMTAKILQLVNSAFFGLRHKINSLQQATVFLGIKTIKGIIIATDVFSKFSDEEVETFCIKELYRHSILSGVLAGKIAATVNNKLVDQASMAGMLHDIGRIMFIRNKPSEYKDILKKSQEMKQDLYIVEQKMLTINHGEIGAYLMSLWRLEPEIVHAIAFHHQPELANDSAFSIVTAVYMADVLYYELVSPEMNLSGINYSYLKKLNVYKLLPQWRDMAKTLVEQMNDADEIF